MYILYQLNKHVYQFAIESRLHICLHYSSLFCPEKLHILASYCAPIVTRNLTKAVQK